MKLLRALKELYIFAENHAETRRNKKCFGESTFNKPLSNPITPMDSQIPYLLDVRFAEPYVLNL